MLDKKIVSELRNIVGKEVVLTSKEDLNAYSYDGTATWAHLPDVVVLPTTAEQVSQIMKMADSNVKAFEGLDYVIADCATCTSALKDYPKFLADTPERKEAYTKFAGKILDISQFLVDVLKLPASAYKPSAQVKGKKVTWHDPCHLNQHLGITSQPRQIIKSIPDIEYVEMPNADRCCGMAGSFSMYYYDLSKQIADKKVEAIKSTGADIVVSSCPGCEIQLIDSLLRNEVPAKGMHIMELLE